ncbi:phosphatidylglycerol lysyltransferase domain-containing protein [Bacillus cereus]
MIQWNRLPPTVLCYKVLAEADRFGYILCILPNRSKWMSLYHDFGYNFFKLGEEAVVDLNAFTITGKKRAGMRATFNRFERRLYILYSPAAVLR